MIAGDLNLCHEDSLAPIVNASDTNPDGSWMARICRGQSQTKMGCVTL